MNSKTKAGLYDIAKKTPLQLANNISRQIGCKVYLKREDLQPVHSFKLRGAYNKIESLTEKEKSKGLIAASAGNHAQGVALSANKLGIDATIVMPKTTPPIKVDAVIGYGAKVILHGDNYSEAQAKCDEIVKKTGKTFIHPFDDIKVIEGQGTIADEIFEVLPDATHVFVCTGGGGMLAGIAKRIKKLSPHIKVISVEPDDSNAMQKSIMAGKRIELAHVGIFADGVAVKKVGEKTFEIAKAFVDDFMSVSIDELCAAIKSIYEDTRTIVEPAGALGVTGAKNYKLPKNAKVVAIASGANMTFEKLQFVAERTLIGSGQEALYSIELTEKPGALRAFCRKVIDQHNITAFNYRLSKRDKAHFFVGVSVSDKEDKKKLEEKMKNEQFPFVDLTNDHSAKEHIRHMIGGVAPNAKKEVFYNVDFPERPQALQDFLNALGDSFNISLFHYRGIGGGTGQVMLGFECNDTKKLENIFKKIGYFSVPLKSKALNLFIKQ